MIHCRGLQSGSENGPGGSEGDGLDAAKFVSEPTTKKSADKSTKIVDRHLMSTYEETYDAALQKTVVDDLLPILIGMSEPHAGVVFDGSVDTSHHPLIVTKEEDGQCCNTVDSDEEVAFAKAVNDIEAADLLHDGSRWCFVTLLEETREHTFGRSEEEVVLWSTWR
ncbi:MAG: hypothetical protein Q9226_008198 [Calogaya cf. arnoldii]